MLRGTRPASIALESSSGPEISAPVNLISETVQSTPAPETLNGISPTGMHVMSFFYNKYDEI